MRHKFFYKEKGENLKTKVQVTKTDIKKGMRTQIDCCPIALAVKRTLKATNLSVTGDGVNFTIKDTRYISDLPWKAQIFVDRFDGGYNVKPFSFILKGEVL